MLKNYNKGNFILTECFESLLWQHFKRKLLIHIETLVDPGRFKPGGLTRFNLTHFDPTRWVNPVYNDPFFDRNRTPG